jgi:hypothetical protein
LGDDESDRIVAANRIAHRDDERAAMVARRFARRRR